MEGKSKRLYNKPKISKVGLLPEEAVLAGCKIANTGKTNKCNNPPATCANRVPGS